MKILHIASEYPPQEVFGLGRFVRDLAIAQAARGHEVHVVSNSMGGADHDLVDEGVHVHRVDFPPPPKPADSGTMVMQFNIQALARILKDAICLDADIVNAHDWLTAPVAQLVARRLQARYVVTVHDLVVGKTGGQLDNESKFIGNHEHAYCRSADLLLCVSAATRQEAIDTYGADSSRSYAIHNAVDPQAFPELPEADVHAFRHALSPLDRPVLLYVGRLDAEKGIDTLVAAFASLTQQGVDAQLVIVGKGSLEDAIRADINKRRLTDRVTITGYVAPPVLNYVFRSAAVHVVPSRYEPFGIVALEGMVCERPIVASAVGGLREIVTDGETGVLVPPGNAEALAAAIGELLTHPDLAATLGRQARERVIRHFSWARVAERIDAILAGVTSPELPAMHRRPARPQIMLVVQTHPPDFPLLEYNRKAFTTLAAAGHHLRFLCLQGEGSALQDQWRGVAEVIEAAAEPGHQHLVRKTLDGYRQMLTGHETWDWLVKIDSDSLIAGDIIAFLDEHADCDAVGKPSTFQPVIDAIHNQSPPLPSRILDRTAGRYLRGFFYGIRREALARAMPLLEQVAPRMRVEDATVTACLLATGARIAFCDYLECYLSGKREFDARSPVLNVGSREPEELAHFAHEAVRRLQSVSPDETGSSPTQPRLSIVTQVRNRAAYLIRMLATAAPQWPQDASVEWIVVDYGGTDDVAVQLRSLDLPGLRYIYADQPGRFSSSHARNIGFQAARASYILALDGDLLLPPGFLNAALQAVAQDAAAPIYGPVYKLMPSDQDSLERGAYEAVVDFETLLSAARPHVIEPPAGAILGAPREMILAVGGYDEGFTGYGFQDIDLIERLRRSGLQDRCPAGVFAVHQFHGYPSDYNTAEIESTNRHRFLELRDQPVRNTGQEWGQLPQGQIDLQSLGWLERVSRSAIAHTTVDRRDGLPIVWCAGVDDARITEYLRDEESGPSKQRWVTSDPEQAARLQTLVSGRRPQDRVECHSSAQVTTQFARAMRVAVFASATHAAELRKAAESLNAPVVWLETSPGDRPAGNAPISGQESELRTVLVSMCEGLGNMIMLTPMLRALTDWLPQAEIHVIGKPAALSLLARMERVQAITPERPPLDVYDLVIVPGWGKAAGQVLHQVKSRRPFVVGGKVATDRHEAEQNMDLLRELGWTGDMPAPYCAAGTVELQPTSRRRVALVDTAHPKSDWTRKRWPHYRELAQRLMADGHVVYALGADCDAAAYRERPWPEGVVDLQGHLALAETAGALAQMDLVIANDCGLAHMAGALNTPTIAIFGPTSVTKNRPLGHAVRVLESGIHCAPCQGTPAWHACDNWRCMDLLGVEQVLSATQDMLTPHAATQAKPASGQRYLLAMPQADRETGYYIRRALEELGAAVTWLEPQIDHSALLTTARRVRPTAILCGREPGMLADLQAIRRELPDVVTALWCMDVRESLADFQRILGPHLDELLRAFDLIYTMAAGQVPEYQAVAPQATVRWLSQGIDPLVHRPEALTEADSRAYECDVLFCGSYRSDMHADRKRLLAAIRKHFDLKLFGYETAIHHSEHNRACRAARIVLGNSAFPQIAKSMSVRDYKVMAAGGFLLTNHVQGIDEVFPIGEVCDTYRSVDECLDKIRYYLQHADERDRIAARAAEFVASEHNYTQRVASIVADVAERTGGDAAHTQPAPNLAYWQKRYAVIGGERTVGPVDWQEAERYDRENERFARIIAPHLPTGGTVLDLGCGIGRWVPLLIQHADAYRGCDIVDTIVADNQARYQHDPRCDFAVYDGRNLPFAGSSFDWIWTCVVLQHITEDEVVAGLAEQIYRRLKPGGRIILTENNLAHTSNHYLTFRTPEQYCRLFAPLHLRQVAEWDFGIGEPHGIFVGGKS